WGPSVPVRRQDKNKARRRIRRVRDRFRWRQKVRRLTGPQIGSNLRVRFGCWYFFPLRVSTLRSFNSFRTFEFQNDAVVAEEFGDPRKYPANEVFCGVVIAND